MITLDPKLPQPAKIDEKAPELLELVIKDKLTETYFSLTLLSQNTSALEA